MQVKCGGHRLVSIINCFFTTFTGAVCFLLVSSAVTMAIPFSFGRIVDIIYKSDATEAQSKLVKTCTILLPIFLVGAACNFGRIYLMNTSGNYIKQFVSLLIFQ